MSAGERLWKATACRAERPGLDLELPEERPLRPAEIEEAGREVAKRCVGIEAPLAMARGSSGMIITMHDVTKEAGWIPETSNGEKGINVVDVTSGSLGLPGEVSGAVPDFANITRGKN